MGIFLRRWLTATLVAGLAGAQVDCHAVASPPPASRALSEAVSGPLAPPARHALAAALVPAPPLALTASDGTGLRLSRLHARAVVEGPLAFTELYLAFDNPQNRTLEGTFRVTLPQRASMARFAMRIDQGWQEAEVVERSHARAAYEDALHRKQDPALLEQSQGNDFSARVFPIGARATKEIVIAWTQELAGGAPYVLPLRGLPEVGAVDAAVTMAGERAPRASLVREAWAPTEDLTVDRASVPTSDGVRSGDLALLRVEPVVDREPDPVRSAVVLFDTSASRALGYEDRIAELKELIQGLGAEARVTVACFDQDVESVYEGPARELADASVARIRQRGALGASDLARAIAWAGGHAKAAGATRVLVVSDGVATAGDTEVAGLAAAARALGAAGVKRLDAVAVGGIRDLASLRAIATAGLAHDGIVVDLSEGSDVIARRLGEATRSKIAVRVGGARWAWPRVIDGAQAGDETLVYAELDGSQPPTVSVDGGPSRTPRLASVERPLLERGWAQAKVADLTIRQTLDGWDSARDKEILDLSLKHRVLGPSTAMLVLETDQDYARFQIDRRAPTAILALEGDRVVQAARAAVVVPSVSVHAQGAWPPVGAQFSDDPLSHSGPPAAAEALRPDSPSGVDGVVQGGFVGDAFGAGGLGLSGVGEGGGGQGEGIGRGSAGVASASRAARPAPTAAARAMSAGGGAGHGRLSGSHQARAAGLRTDDATEWAADVRERAAPSEVPAYSGKLADVMSELTRGDKQGALETAKSWRASDAGDVMALVALGEALEATGAQATAARAYGSIVDLFPGRADMRRFAGERLERLGDEAALDLAIDTYTKANVDRPDHPSSHRLLAFALLRRGRFAAAFDAAVAGLAHPYPRGRFAGVDRVLREDLGLIGAAWAKAEPEKQADIRARVRAAGGTLEEGPSLRFVLTWETDANDVDLHVEDARGGHAFYQAPNLPSGGSLYADVTTGYGPECFTIRAPADRRAGPYKLRANYYARGPMGYGMGKLEVIEHDGRGGLRFEEKPFVVMNDHAFVDVGVVAR